jgi:hypothetical protein
MVMNNHACNFPAMSIPYFVTILIPDREESLPFRGLAEAQSAGTCASITFPDYFHK